MVLVFIFLGLIIIILSFTTIMLLSTIQIKVINLILENKKERDVKRINNSYKIKIGIYFFNKIPILWINLNSKKIKKISSSKSLPKVDFQKLKNKENINKKILALIKNIQIKVKNIKLDVNIGTIDAVLTSYLVAVIASIIGIVLPHITEKNNINTCYFIVNPKYQNKNEYNIKFEGIIYIKIVHIIFSMLNFVRKGSNENERTSNRRAYDYGYEQY